MTVKNTISDTRVPVKIWTDEIEDTATDQLKNIANLPFVHHHVAAMPDVHLGIGATIGSVIPTHKAIIPASVGVDIGCGMMAVETSLKAEQLPDNLRQLRLAIESAVPVGFNMHSVRNIPEAVAGTVNAGLVRILTKYPKLAENAKRGTSQRWARQIGTLGGGNHFIEVCLDTEGKVWVMLHSGSRGIGNKIGSHFIAEAKDILNRVVEAEKVAQANVIRRREETAATRSLLNTAKLMDENPTLMRLKELETLEKVTEKVDRLTVFGGLDGVLNDTVRINLDSN